MKCCSLRLEWAITVSSLRLKAVKIAAKQGTANLCRWAGTLFMVVWHKHQGLILRIVFYLFSSSSASSLFSVFKFSAEKKEKYLICKLQSGVLNSKQWWTGEPVLIYISSVFSVFVKSLESRMLQVWFCRGEKDFLSSELSGEILLMSPEPARCFLHFDLNLRRISL